MNLSKQIDTKINKERDELTQDITTQITETQEKIIFAVVRKSTVERGHLILSLLTLVNQLMLLLVLLQPKGKGCIFHFLCSF